MRFIILLGKFLKYYSLFTKLAKYQRLDCNFSNTFLNVIQVNFPLLYFTFIHLLIYENIFQVYIQRYVKL